MCVTRHWFSTFFVLISLVGLYALVRRKADRSIPLCKEEKLVLTGMGLFFVAYLLPLFKAPIDVSDLEVEVRYLLFIPVYLLVRESAHKLRIPESGPKKFRLEPMMLSMETCQQRYRYS